MAERNNNTTLSNFKSLDPNIQNIKDIEKILKEPLRYQYILEKHTTPFEMQKDWNNDNDLLQQFTITVEDIDRLYYIKHNLSKNSEYVNTYNLIARMQYEEKSIYVDMCFICDYSNNIKIGSIYISRNAKIFMNIVLRRYKDINKDLIYDSLLKDDIYVEEYNSNKLQLPKMINKKENVNELMSAKKDHDLWILNYITRQVS